jgi:hypothetical protein
MFCVYSYVTRIHRSVTLETPLGKEINYWTDDVVCKASFNFLKHLTSFHETRWESCATGCHLCVVTCNLLQSVLTNLLLDFEAAAALDPRTWTQLAGRGHICK